jgi:hypothetical protein
MPVKLPAPSFGTAAQAAPNGSLTAAAVAIGVVGSDAMDDAADEADDPLFALDEDESPLLPQAVRPRVRAPAASRAAAARVRVLVTDMVVNSCWVAGSGQGGAVAGTGGRLLSGGFGREVERLRLRRREVERSRRGQVTVTTVLCQPVAPLG